MATVQDISGVSGDPAYDAYAGDIRNARVSLVDRDSADDHTPFAGCSNLTPTLVNASDLKTGVVSCTTTLSMGSSDQATDFTVGIVVGGYYTSDRSLEDSVLYLYKPGTGFLGGGGYIINSASAGLYGGTSGARTNFGFNAKAKTSKVFQGHVNMIIRRQVNGVWKAYQIKSTSIDSLTITTTSPSTGTGQFVSKANITDITDSLHPIAIGGGYQLQITVTDNGEPGSSDKVAVTLLDGSTLLFSTNWSGAPPKTVEQTITGGNLQAR